MWYNEGDLVMIDDIQGCKIMFILDETCKNSQYRLKKKLKEKGAHDECHIFQFFRGSCDGIDHLPASFEEVDARILGTFWIFIIRTRCIFECMS